MPTSRLHRLEPSPLSPPPRRQADASHLSKVSAGRTWSHARTQGWRWLLCPVTPFVSCKSNTFLFLCADGRGHPTEKQLLPVPCSLLWGQVDREDENNLGKWARREREWHRHNRTDTDSFIPTRLWRLAAFRASVQLCLQPRQTSTRTPATFCASGTSWPWAPAIPPFCSPAREVKRRPPNTNLTRDHVSTFLAV